MEDPTTLHTPRMVAPFSLAIRKATSVSGRFTTLTDGNHHIFGRKNRIPVPEFRRIFDLHRNPCIGLDQVLTHQCRMPRGTATNQDNSPGLDYPWKDIQQSSQHNRLPYRERSVPGKYPLWFFGCSKISFSMKWAKITFFDFADRLVDLRDFERCRLVFQRF